jgi:hypothetical protein
MLFTWRMTLYLPDFFISLVSRHLLHLKFSRELYLYYFCCLMFYAESQCLLNVPCFFCRFDKELNKEVAIKVIDLEEA